MRKKRLTLFALTTVLLLSALLAPPILRLYAPERAVKQLLDYLHDGRFSKAESLSVSDLGPDYESSRKKDLYKAIYATMRYTIADCERIGDSACVIVLITIVDMDDLISEYSDELLTQSLEGGNGWLKRYDRQLTRKLRSGDTPMETLTVEVNLVRSNGRWRVDAENSSEFVKAISGGI